MAGATRRGRYTQCIDCEHRIEVNTDKKFSCSYSHKMIRKYANDVGIELERDFKFCGLYKYNNVNIKENDENRIN